MRSPIRHTLAVFVLAAIPAAGFAQSQAAARANPAAEHLAGARAALNKVLNAPAPSGEAFTKLSDLKTEYIALEKSASTASPDWSTHYSAIDRLVGELIGAGPAASGEPGAVGTSGQSGAMKGVGPEVAENLSTFRTELKAFSTAMSAVTPSANPSVASPPAPPAAPAAASPSVASAAAAATAAPSATPSATGTSGAAAPSPTPSADTGIAAQIDPVIALVDGALRANPADASGKVTVDRAALDAIKAQLQVIKAKKQ